MISLPVSEAGGENDTITEEEEVEDATGVEGAGGTPEDVVKYWLGTDQTEGPTEFTALARNLCWVFGEREEREAWEVPGLGVPLVRDTFALASNVYHELGAFSYSVWTSNF